MSWFGMDSFEYQTCEECGYWWDITRKPGKHVWLRLYATQPWFNHIVVKCPKCGHKWRLFDMKRGFYRRLLIAGASRVGKRFASDKVIADFEKEFDIHSVTSRKLTPRQERLVQYYRQMLEDGFQPPLF